MSRTAPTKLVTRASVALSALLLAGTAACSGSPSGDEADGTGDAATTATEVQVTISAGKVAGRLAKPAQAEVVDSVGAVAEGWLRAAYPVDGERLDLDRALVDFTAQAAKAARAQRSLLSAGGSGATAQRARVVVDVLAPMRKVSGATARIRVVLSDDAGTRDTLSGRLLLIPVKKGWRVFGFDLARGADGGRKGADGNGKKRSDKKDARKGGAA